MEMKSIDTEGLKFMAEKIIIFSGKQYAGKDTAAQIMLKELSGFRRCAIGDIIKLTYAKEHNLTFDEIEKDKTKYRAGLIKLGNWGRAQSPDYWLNKIVEQDSNIIVTDVRIPHEYKVFKDAGAISIRVEADRKIREKRGGKLIGETDITEIGLDHITDWDYVLNNNSDYETLVSDVKNILIKMKIKGQV